MNTRLPTVMMMVFLALACLSAPMAYGGLAQIGPINPTSGYPDWYMDENGVALEPCLGLPARCLSTPVIPGNPASAAAGFGDEAFYWLIDPLFRLGPNGEDLTGSRMALELAWNTALGNPAPGRQMVFSRLRVRATKLQQAGFYTYVTPWGSVRIPAQPERAPDGPFSINFTDDDIGLAAAGFAAPLVSPNLGPFLVSIRPPAGFIGNGTSATAFTGGTNGNAFQLLSPTGAVITAARSGVLVGKLATNGGLQDVSATYRRTAAGNGAVDVTAHSITSQRIVAGGVAGTRARLRPQAGNLGHYFRAIPFAAGDAFSRVRVVNATDASRPAVVVNPVRDVASISSATWSTSTQTLSVVASSSDNFAAEPVVFRIIDVGSGALLGTTGNNVAFNLITPVRPVAVRVVSNKGGRTFMRVRVVP